MHHLSTFKGFRDASIELLNPLVLMIGRNGSGKTNAIEGIELLAHLAQGTSLPDITDITTNAGLFQVRGGIEGCVSTQSHLLELGFSAGKVGRNRDVKYSVSVATGGGPPRIYSESLKYMSEQKMRTFFEVVPDEDSARTGTVRVKYDNFARGGNKPSVSTRGDRSVLSQLRSLIPASDKNEAALKLASIVQTHLRAAFAFDPTSRSMRSYARQGQRMLLRDGSNLSSVLHSLSVGGQDERDALARVTTAIQTLPEEPIAAIEFVTTQLGDVILGLKSSLGNQLVDARTLSDGTLRALAILTAAETAPIHSRLIVEEVDNGVHPSRVAALMRYLVECGKRRNLNILCTTHNPSLLDALAHKELDSVVICHRDSATGYAKLTPLSEVPRFDELLAAGRVGDLVTRNVLEKYLDPGHEKRRRDGVASRLAELP